MKANNVYSIEEIKNNFEDSKRFLKQLVLVIEKVISDLESKKNTFKNFDYKNVILCMLVLNPESEFVVSDFELTLNFFKFDVSQGDIKEFLWDLVSDQKIEFTVNRKFKFLKP